MVNGMENYEFQENCVEYLFDKTTTSGTKQVITVKAPTGVEKTVILVKYVDLFLENTDGKTAKEKIFMTKLRRHTVMAYVSL